MPIVEQIMQATWNFHAPKAPLPPPSAEAARFLKAMPIDLNSGQKLASAKNGGFTEYFRLDAHKKLRDTQYRAGRTAFTGAERADARPRRERRPAAATGCCPAAAQSNGPDAAYIAGIVRALT